MLATPTRRLDGLLLDVLLFYVTLGIGWLVWSWVERGSSGTLGMRLVLLQVRHDDTPAGRGRMAARELRWKCLALLVGLDSARPQDGDDWRVYTGDKSESLVMSPWVIDSDDRENNYVESVLWADLVPVDEVTQ